MHSPNGGAATAMPMVWLCVCTCVYKFLNSVNNQGLRFASDANGHGVFSFIGCGCLVRAFIHEGLVQTIAAAIIHIVKLFSSEVEACTDQRNVP